MTDEKQIAETVEAGCPPLEESIRLLEKRFEVFLNENEVPDEIFIRNRLDIGALFAKGELARQVSSCGITVVRDSAEEVIEAWNTRTDPCRDALRALVEAVKGYFTVNRVPTSYLIDVALATAEKVLGEEGE
jgi:hypothetical protein